MANRERRVSRAGGRAPMHWVGVVKRRPDPYIARPTWLALIADHRLRPIESFASVCPATGRTFRYGGAPLELAAFPRRGARVGVVVWHPTSKGLELHGDPAAMARLGKELARAVGGVYGPPGDA